MQQNLVSILIPFKNTEDFLFECLNSILAQTYQNWEVIAINDNSTDESQPIVAKFSQKDKRIKTFENLGNGIIAALRLAYSKSKGRFITRMDSDDIMKPNKLELMVDSLNEYGVGHLALGQVAYFAEKGINDGYARYEKWLNALTSTGSNYSEIYKECVIPSPSWMAFREDFDKCGAFETDRYPEDYDLAFRFRRQDLKCIPCQEIIHLWRDYETRTSRTSEHYAQNYFLEIKLHYFLEEDFDKNRPLVVWGAGNKGKSIAKNLCSIKMDFSWVCDNPKKIGKTIYGIELRAFQYLKSMRKPQSIITVANEKAQQNIREYLLKLGQVEMKDYFFFC